MNSKFTFFLILLFKASLLIANESPAYSISRLLDEGQSTNEKEKAVKSIIMDAEGTRLLKKTASEHPNSLATAFESLFRAKSPARRSLVLDAIVKAQSKESYLKVRDQAFTDESSEVRAQAFGAAALFDDHDNIVINAVVNEINSTKAGPALLASTQLASKFALSEAVIPLLNLLSNERLSLRALAASSLAAYSTLPNFTKSKIANALKESEKDIAKMEAIHKYLPSSKAPKSGNVAEVYKDNLTQALHRADN